MTPIVLDLTPTLQRQALREIMEGKGKSLDWLAGQMRIPTENLRRWLYEFDPETNRQRYEWHTTHQAVILFLQTEPWS